MTPKTKRYGFTLVEALIVLSVVGVLLAIGFPRIKTALIKSSVRSARSSVVTLYNQSRARAIREGRSVTLRFTADSAWTTASPRRSAGSGSCDTVGTARKLNSLYGVTVTATPDSFRIDPRGLGIQPSTSGTTVLLARAGYHDSVLISGYGRVSK